MEHLITKLKNSGIRIELAGEKIKLDIPKDVKADEFIAEVKHNKARIISFLKKSTCKDHAFIELKKSAAKNYYQLSSAQKRLYFLYQMDKNSLAYNMPQIMIVEGVLDKEKLEASFEKLIERHESLRTSFHEFENGPMQKIEQNLSFNIEYHHSTEEGVAGIVRNFIKPFDLATDPLLRVGVILQDASEALSNKCVLMVDMHHIITDGVSQSTLINDFMNFYIGRELPPIDFHYKDFAEWQQSTDYSKAIKDQKAFWLDQFVSEAPVLELPVDFPRPVERNYRGGTIEFELSEEQTRGLRSLASLEGTTLFMATLAIFNILLKKLSGQQDIIVGTTVAGRTHADLERTIGMFVNSLPLRTFPSGEKLFIEFLHEVTDNTLHCFENQNYQFEDLIADLKIKRESSRNPLFDVLFSYQVSESTATFIPGIRISPYYSDFSISKFDLSLSIIEQEQQLSMTLEFSSELFEHQTVQRFANYFQKIVSEVLRDKNISLSRINIFPEEERILLDSFNGKQVSYPQDKTIVELFEYWVERQPHAIAAVFQDKALSYAELSGHINALCAILRQEQIARGSYIVLLIDHSFELLVSLLATLKCGCAFVPVDVNWPVQRINDIIDSLEPALVLSVTQQPEYTFHEKIRNVCLNQKTELKSKISTVSPLPDDSVYVIYTSGSTGKPKGVVVPWKGLMNRLFWMNDFFGVETAQSVLQTTRYVYDSSVWQLCWPLINGGKTIILPSQTELTYTHVSDLIHRHQVRLADFVPSVFNTIFEYTKDPNHEVNVKLKSLDFIIQGGEEITEKVTRQFLELNPSIKIINLYGPTEASIGCIYHQVERTGIGKIPIGRPISNVRVFILDSDQQPVPIGVQGELCIAGVCLAKGYHNASEQTKSKFVFVNTINETVYRTGDLAKRKIDGNIEFLGRIDNQIKVRGFRIETGEIEVQLAAYPQIREVTILAAENNGDKFLVAYYVSEREFDSVALREFLIERLPEYMVPTFFIHLAKMPINISGKLDRRLLPIPSFKDLGVFIAPANSIEMKLTELWSEILKVERSSISTKVNFFELGGQSLKASVLLSKIRKEFNVSLSLSDFFKHQDIQSQSLLIQKAVPLSHQSIPKAESKQYYKLTSAQKRIYFLSELNPDSTIYNLPKIIRLSGEFDDKRLRTAVIKLLERHESLNTFFKVVDGEIVQIPSENVCCEPEAYQATEKDIESILGNFIRPFDLNRAPLLRVGILHFSETEHLLMLDTHHIATDGVSESIILKDFIALYCNTPLLPIQLQYKDYAEWQQSEEQQIQIDRQKEFWLGQYPTVPSPLNLPTDFPRPNQKDHAGATESFKINSSNTANLKKIGTENGLTLFTVLLGVYNIMLAKLCNQEDIIVGTPTAGRTHADLGQVVGMFVNTLALRNHPRNELRFNEFISTVNVSSLACFDNQSYPYESLVEALQINRDPGRNPLFDVMFAVQNFDEERLVLPGLAVQSYQIENSISKFDLTLTCVEEDNELTLNFEYATSLFKGESIKRFFNYFNQIVQTIIVDSQIRIGEIDFLPAAEKELILHRFNDTYLPQIGQHTVISLFEEQVKKNPHRLAFRSEDNGITYETLNRKSDFLAAHFLHNGLIKKGELVGVLLGRGESFIVSVLALLKAGGAYVPIDPEIPEGRKDIIIKDAEIKLLLTDHNYQRSTTTIDIINVDELLLAFNENDSKCILPEPQQKDLAYVIYTSGSTGKPKAVMINHGALINLCLWHRNNFKVSEWDQATLYSSVGFDASVWELFPYIISGACVWKVPDDIRLDVRKLNEYYNDKGITISFLPTVMGERFMETNNTSLRCLLLGGDKLHIYSPKPYRIYNNYGPTENAVVTTCIEVTEQKVNIPIGQPISNVRIYILANDHLVPIGAPGEIYIAGESLATGYLNDDNLTKEKFVHVVGLPEERLYRTGDIGRWLPDGNIEFLGRSDNQVKIRGFRIEIGEIETILSHYKKIKESVIQLLENEIEKYLVLYYVPIGELTVSEIRDYLKEYLPVQMIPTFFVPMKELPLNINGKVDRTKLPKPIEPIEDELQHPTTIFEQRLAEIWYRVLKLRDNRINVNKSFFEMGGHSLKASELASLIRQEFQIQLPLIEVFRLQTIKEIAGFLSKQPQTSFHTSAILLKDPGEVQGNIFFIHDGSGDINSYSQLCNHVTTHRCWGLQLPMRDQNGPRQIDIIKLASYHIENIKKIQPKGPYHIVGWSLGGMIAYEMVVQLELSGHQVEKLILLDVDFSSYSHSQKLDLFHLSDECKLISSEFEIDTESLANSKNTQELWIKTIELLKERHDVVDYFISKIPTNIRQLIPHLENLELEDLARSVNTIRSLVNSASNYHPAVRIEAKTWVVKAMKSNVRTDAIVPYLQNPVNVELNSSHFEILSPPFISELTTILSGGSSLYGCELREEIVSHF